MVRTDSRLRCTAVDQLVGVWTIPSIMMVTLVVLSPRNCSGQEQFTDQLDLGFTTLVWFVFVFRYSLMSTPQWASDQPWDSCSCEACLLYSPHFADAQFLWMVSTCYSDTRMTYCPNCHHLRLVGSTHRNRYDASAWLSFTLKLCLSNSTDLVGANHVQSL